MTSKLERCFLLNVNVCVESGASRCTERQFEMAPKSAATGWGVRMPAYKSSKSLFLSVTACAALFTHATLALAQASAPGPAANPAATSEPDELQEVVVTAQRREEALSKVPVSVSAFNREALVERKIQTESDLTSLVPGLQLTVGESASEFDFAIRGQTTDDYSGSPPAVLAYVNEVAVAPHSESSSSFYDLESIQVLKGPQGTLFGRNTTGGAVLYTTAQPSLDKVQGYATVSGGNFDYRELQGAVNIPLVSDLLAIRVAGDKTEKTGYVTNIEDGVHMGDIDHSSARVTVLFTPLEGLKDTFFLQYNRVNDTNLNGEIYSYYAVGQTNNGFPLNTLASELYGAAVPAALSAQQSRGYHSADIWFTPHTDSRATSIQNATSYNIYADITIKNIFGKSTTLSHEQADLSGTPFGVISLHDDNGNKFDQETLSDELQIQGDVFAHKLRYIGGIYWSQNSEDIDSPVTVGETIPPPFGPIAAFHYANETTDHSTALFAQATYDLSQLSSVEGLSFTAGYRYTWERLTISQLADSQFAKDPGQSTNESNPSWQIGLQDQINPDLLVYVVTRGSWRAGGYNGVTPPINGADAFGPERTHDVEIGTKFAGRLFDRAAHFNVALYDQIVDNAERDIYYVVSGNVSSLTTNIPQSQIRGVEADGDIRALRPLTVGFQVAYTNADWKKPQVTLPGGQVAAASSYANTPRWSGSIYAKFDLPTPDVWGPMYVRADVYAQSSEFFSNFEESLTPGTEIAGYTLLNMRYGWNIAHTNASIAVFGKNLTSRQYFLGGESYGTSDGINVVIPGPPRTFGAEFTYKF